LRNTLVTALVSCADASLRNNTRRFLRGLSSDELQFIAEFLGSCILEAPGAFGRELEHQIASFQRMHLRGEGAHLEDQEHKMILLFEYLHRTGTALTQQPVN
jgi:hypothetical protein